MTPAVRFVLVTTVQIAAVVVAIAFLATVLFESGEWSKPDWFLDLPPLLMTIIVINVAIQAWRLHRRAKRSQR
jgi:membrane protein DedA with SNARE-associated domain